MGQYQELIWLCEQNLEKNGVSVNLVPIELNHLFCLKIKFFLRQKKRKKKRKELKKSEASQHQDVVLKNLKRIQCPKNLCGYLFLYYCTLLIVFFGV